MLNQIQMRRRYLLPAYIQKVQIVSGVNFI